MGNPMMTRLNSGRNGMLEKINAVKQMISGQNPGSVYTMMMNTNPQFRSFVEQNKGKTPQQIAGENGIDYTLVQKLFG